MNGTIIDIPGISVSINPVSLHGSTDSAYIIEIKDKYGNSANIHITYDKITYAENSNSKFK